MVEGLAKAVREAAVNGDLACATAFALAEQLGVTPLAVGEEADGQGINLSKCHLGLFGYGPKAEGKSKRVVAMTNVPADLAEAIRAALDSNGRLTCAEAWRIAAELGQSRQTVSDAAEGLGVRVIECQIGAF